MRNWLFLLTFLVSCGPVKNDERDHEREVTRLGTTSAACWEALRWRELRDTATCYEKTPDQMDFLERWSGPAASTITSLEILRVEVSERKTNDEPPVLYEGTVYLRVEKITAQEQVVQNDMVRQRWYRTPQGWFVETGQEKGF